MGRNGGNGKEDPNRGDTERIGEGDGRKRRVEDWGGLCLVYKVPSIIGCGRFVRQRGRTVVGTPISSVHQRRENARESHHLDCVTRLMMGLFLSLSFLLLPIF
ncbi:hypothetical protein SLE2022_182300 [Rubroshorea leprosula]